MTQYIKAPFNFVPLNTKVYTPSWADQVSHDIPFSDGESGEIELTLTAKTPVFVRNGHTREDADKKDEKFTSFSKDANGNYFIPATSVKGMIRNVLEIISFGKMKVDRNMKFAQREWNNPTVYTLKEPAIQNSMHCGWLQLSEYGDSTIIDCGLPQRINHIRIDEFFKSKGIPVSFHQQFSKDSKTDLNKERELHGSKYDPKNAVYKYALLESQAHILENLSFEIDETYNTATHATVLQSPMSERRYKVAHDDEGDLRGTIVFTGQPDRWINPEKAKRGPKSGKFYEFIFPNSEREIPIRVEKETIGHFTFIYKDSPAWKLFASKQRIPVFFRIDNTTGSIKDFGLALLYRLPYKFSVKDLIDRSQEIEHGRLDLSECMFGYTEKESALKARVQFSNFYSKGTVEPMDQQTATLGSPKASYYPIYLEQGEKNDKNGIASLLKTYNDPRVKIAGRKRYPIRDQAVPRALGNEMLDSRFCPLPAEAIFSGKIRFHNLRPVEVGALISALTFHGHNKRLYHNIGMGKPLGYGKLQADVKVRVNDTELDFSPYLIAFEKELDSFCKNYLQKGWKQSEVVEELFTMASDVECQQNNLLLEYMKMDPKGVNEFAEAKKKNEYLQRFSVLSKQPFKIASPLEAFEQIEAELEQQRHEAEAKQQKAIEEAEQLAVAEEEEKRLIAKRAKEIEEGLSAFIDDLADFDSTKRRVDQWLKKAGVDLLPESQHQILFSALERIYNGSGNRDKKRWNLSVDKNPIWQKIAGWVGADLANRWYRQIVKE